MDREKDRKCSQWNTGVVPDDSWAVGVAKTLEANATDTIKVTIVNFMA